MDLKGKGKEMAISMQSRGAELMSDLSELDTISKDYGIVVKYRAHLQLSEWDWRKKRERGEHIAYSLSMPKKEIRIRLLQLGWSPTHPLSPSVNRVCQWVSDVQYEEVV